MFQGMKIATKKSSKKDTSKKSNRGKASLEETRGSELTKSFSERFDYLGIGSSNTYKNSNTSESRTLAKIIENQGEILHQLQELNSKVRRLENQFKEIEEKMNNNFNFTNEKTFKEDIIKGATRILIEKSIYPTEDQIKSEVENYARANYKDNLRKFTSTQWNSYYMKNFHKLLLEKIRALRGTLTTKIKSSTFFIFGNLLELINNRASPETVLKWK
ncbi:hypothetical protein F8M41_005006 [Gigaspora margarita]|uniref:Uncharacterized protein n=1 Tax=Gigaspora margarita TaxID=4874 RepID=A0A8H4A6G6_GIGMA|nr:hypothetical protein F8M41_005006 [Gigaspora margarita]